MRKVIKLTESDLTRIVRRVFKENEEMDHQSQMDAWREEDRKKSLKPNSIEVKFLPKWEEFMSNKKSGYLSGNINIGSTVMLYANGSGQKIGTGPYEIENDRQVFYYATYRPDSNQINVSGYFCFGDAVIGDYNPKHLLNKDPESYFKARRNGENMRGLGFCKSGGNFHSEFDSFNIGETDNNDFFEVVKTDGEYQPKEDEQLFERYYKRRRY